MEQGNLVKKAWSLLTRDKGWIKPILIMPLADMVPIVGAMGTHGYVLEWARLTAWGVDSAPKQKNVQIGKCISSGFRAFVVALGFGACIMLVSFMIRFAVSVLPEAPAAALALLFGLVQSVFSLFYNVFLPICCIRSSIYESIGAGYRIDRVFQMIQIDVSGFMKIVAINFLASLIAGAILLVLFMIGAVAFVPFILAVSTGESVQSMVMVLAPFVMLITVLVIVVGYALGVLFHIYGMMLNTIVALWMRQFDVSSWGKSADPLPDSVTDSPEAPAPHVPMDDEPAGQPEVQESVATNAPAQYMQDAEPFTPALDEEQQPSQPTQGAFEEERTTRIKLQKTVDLGRTDNMREDPAPDEGAASEPKPESAQEPNPEQKPDSDDIESLYSKLNDLMHRDDE